MYKIPVLCSSNAQASPNRTSNYTHMYMYLNTIATFSHQKQNINLKAGSNKSSRQNLKLFSIVIWQPQSHICTLKMKIIKLNLLEHILSNYIVNKGFNWWADDTNFCIFATYFPAHQWRSMRVIIHENSQPTLFAQLSLTLVLILDLSLKNPFIYFCSIPWQ